MARAVSLPLPRFCHHLVVVLIALLATTSMAQARTVYIDDTLYAPIRSGQGTQYRILHNGLRSGTPLTLLEQSGETGYSKVRTRDGIEGWIPSRYLTNQPIASDRLDAANQELENTRNQLQELRAEMETLTGERDQLATQVQQLQQRGASLSEELSDIRSVSANALNLDRQNRELQESNQVLKNEVEVLTAEVEHLEAKKESDFMLLGAGLLVLGMIISLILPWLKPSKKSDTWA